MALLYRAMDLEMCRTGEPLDSLYRNAMDDLRAALGDRHPDYIWALTPYSAYLQGRIETIPEAQANYEYVLQVREAEGRGEDADAAWACQNLAILHHGLEHFAVAESLYDRAYDIRSRVFGRNRLTARSLIGVAQMKFMRGDFPGGKARLDEVLRILEEQGGDEDDDRAICLVHLGRYAVWTGDFRSAVPNFERADRIWKKRKRPRQRVDCLHELARCRLKQGRTKDAVRVCRQALSIAVDAFGPGGSIPDPIELGTARLELANALGMDDRVPESDAAFEAGRAEVTAAAGDECHRLGWAWFDRGRVLLRRGNFEPAAQAFGASLTILERDLGPTHPQLMQCQLGLAESWMGLDNPSAAMERGLEAHDAEIAHVSENVRFMTQFHALQFRRTLASSSDLLLTLLDRYPELRHEYAARVWDALINDRALITDEMLKRHRSRGSEPDPLLKALEASGRRLANLTCRGSDAMRAEGYVKQIEAALAEKDSLERAAIAAGLAAPTERIRLSDVLDALPKGASLAGYFRFGDPSGSAGAGERYGAFVGDHPGRVTYRSLGPAAPIDSSVTRWRLEASPEISLTHRDAAHAEQSYRLAGADLRRRVWDPVENACAEGTDLFVVLDGSLQLTSFAVLPRNPGGYLIETGRHFSYLSAERDLLRAPFPRGSGLLAIANPAFNVGPTRSQNAVPSRQKLTTLLRAPGAPYDSLPGSEWEARTIVAKAPACGIRPMDLLLGPEANERRIRETVAGHGIVHFGSHSIGLTAGSVADADDPLAEIVADLGGGVALAGANLEHREGEDDGLLTGAEILNMDLSGVRVVVLSACGTALGNVARNEGVFGLRRVLHVAGVPVLVMSLWPVGDDATSEWMSPFYDRLCAGDPVRLAAEKASLQVLAEHRRAGRSTHPFYWGSFIATGDTERLP